MKNGRKTLLRNQCPGLNYSAAKVRTVIRALDEAALFPAAPGELSVVFLDDRRIARLHGDFMEDPTPTDVITFPGCPEMDSGGEICVSAEHAFHFARQRSLDFSREVTLYLVHGYLHLAGFDDIHPAAKRRMRRAEKKAMAFLESSHHIPDFTYADNRHEPF